MRRVREDGEGWVLEEHVLGRFVGVSVCWCLLLMLREARLYL